MFNWKTVLVTCLFFANTVLSEEQAISTGSVSLFSISSEANKIADQYSELGWFSGSILLAKDNKIFFTKSFGMANQSKSTLNSDNTKYNLGSIMKDFTKVLVLQQIQNGKLKLNDKLGQFKLGFSQTETSEVTVEQLLNHTAGFEDIFVAEYRENLMYFDTLAKKLELLIDQPLLFKPGTERRYSNYGYVVLGVILEKVAGQSFEKLLEANIFQPVGMKNTSFKVQGFNSQQSVRYTYKYDNTLSEVGIQEHPGPSGGIEATIYDLQKFYRTLFYTDKLLNRANDVVKNQFKMEGEQWVSFGGGLGISAAAEINLAKGMEIIVLSNSDKLVAELISGRINSFVNTGRYQPVTELEINFTYAYYKKHGKEAFYQGFSQAYSEHGYTQFLGRVINELGMQLIQSSAWDDAITIFDYLVYLYPNAPQAYDSLAFGFYKKEQHEKAKTTFQKALSINSEFNSDYVSSNYQ